MTVLTESGRIVRRLVENRHESAGLLTVSWDRRSDRGRLMPAGVYVVRVDAVAPDERAGVIASTEAA